MNMLSRELVASKESIVKALKELNHSLKKKRDEIIDENSDFCDKKLKFIRPAAVRAHGSATAPIATVPVGPSVRPSSPTPGTLRTPTAKPTTPTVTMSGGIASPLRRSNRHATSADGSSTTDEHSLAKAMRR